MARLDRFGAEEFDGKLLRRSGTWAVCFLADWCPFCAAFRPIFERMQARALVSLAIADVTDLESPLWDRFALDVVPTVLVFKDGRETWRKDGVLGAGLVASDLEPLLRAGAGTRTPKRSR